MVLRFFSFAVIFLFASCTELGERDNPDDPKSKNYSRGVSSGSSSSSEVPIEPSSSSEAVSSSSEAEPSSSSSSSSAPSSSSEEYTGGSCNADDYGVVPIGTQTWMTKNWGCYVQGSKCYNNDPSNCNTYGRLYDWKTAKEACPNGWHLPTEDELDALMYHVDNDKNILNLYGFSARGGCFNNNGFNGVGSFGYWWTNVDNTTTTAYRLHIGESNELIYLDSQNKNYFYSVRCVKD